MHWVHPNPMNSTLTRRFKRATAWAMLLVWLFVVSAGVANACLLEERSHGHRPGIAAQEAARAAVGVSHHEAPGATAGEDEPAESKAACQKVCDESPQSPVKQSSAADVDSPAPAPALGDPWTAGVMVDPAQRYRARRSHVPPPGPPPRVRYSRLAL